MPHSSGGGSFGGGSHGGSSGSGSSSTPHNAVRASYFAGASRYVCYRGGRAYYYYSDLDPTQYKKSAREAVTVCIVALIFLVVGILGVVFTRRTPQKLLGATNTTVSVVDNANVIENETELLQTLQQFADKTGVVPVVVTCYEEDWNVRNFGDLQQYAFKLYLNICPDEYHWLLVYSIKDNESAQTTWRWEGMQGDETDSVLHSAFLDKFNSSVQGNLENNIPVGECFNNVFAEMLPVALDTYTDFGLMAAGGIFAVVGLLLLVYVVLHFRQIKMFATAEKIDLKAKEISCPACGGRLVEGTHKCPHCGAEQALPPTDVNIENTQGK